MEVNQDIFWHGRRTVPTFASMSNTRIVIALLLLLSGNHVKAQFNTVSCPGNRYKVTVENPTRTTNKAEATPESITSVNEKSVPDKVSLSSTDTKKERAGSSLSQRMLSALTYQDKFALRLSERPIHGEEEVSQWY